MENEEKSHKNGLMRCKKIMKNKKLYFKVQTNRITPRKERFLCQINNKKEEKEIPLCWGCLRTVDDLFAAGTHLN
jgi:hypothetical protein